MAVPERLAAPTMLPLLLLLLVWLPLLSSACDRCVRHFKASYYTSSLTLSGTSAHDRFLCFFLLLLWRLRWFAMQGGSDSDGGS